MTRAFLTGEIALPEQKDLLILEILEDIEPTPDIVSAVKRLAQQGYRLALDDYEHRPEFSALLPFVELVKLDVRALSADALAEHVEILGQYSCSLLAEKVETREEFEMCRELGFDYFQGYFFCQPERLRARRPGVNHTSTLRLMTRLQDDTCSFDEIQSLIGNDAALSVRLLRFVNSPFCGVGREVNSVRDALSLVGLTLVRRWVTLMLMSRLGEGKSSELINVALVRGRTCELLGEGCAEHDPGEYFTVGLFSIMDALFDQPMGQAVEALPLNPSIKSALCKSEGVLGATLENVLRFEIEPTAPDLASLGHAHNDAVRWCTEVGQIA